MVGLFACTNNQRENGVGKVWSDKHECEADDDDDAEMEIGGLGQRANVKGFYMLNILRCLC